MICFEISLPGWNLLPISSKFSHVEGDQEDLLAIVHPSTIEEDDEDAPIIWSARICDDEDDIEAIDW